MANNKRNGKSKNMGSASFERTNKARNNSRKPRSQRQEDRNFDRDNGAVIPKTNDSTWYTANAKLVEASARIPFPYRPGLNMPQFFKNCNAALKTTSVNLAARIPGVYTIDWFPSVGVSSNVTSPISLAARDIFSKVRSSFSGSLQADAPDFIIHMMAMDSVYSYISYLKRLYKVIVTFNPDNQVTPEVLLQAMGWSADDIHNLMSSKVELFGIINELISMTNRFYTPNIMPVFQRHVWMSERIYCDAPSVNSQMYLFNLTHVYKFGVDDRGAGQLELIEVPKQGTPDSLFTFGRELIQAISDWDDGYIINGYLTRAYEGSTRFTISELNLEDRLEMVYNEVVLSQIENATCAPVGVRNVYGSITQDVNTNALETRYSAVPDPNHKLEGMQWTVNRINCRAEQPSAIDVIEASRLMTKWHMTPSIATVIECGTEVVTNMRVMAYQTHASKWNSVLVNNMVLVTTVESQLASRVGVTALSDFIAALGVFSSFDWHPIMMVGSQSRTEDGTSSNDAIGLLGDIHNITFISDTEMSYINRCCLYSEFGSFGD